MRVPCSVSSSAARSASVKTDASRHAATRLSRNEVSPAFAASLVCISRQKPQPLIWLARIFISSWVAAGSAEATAALFAETRYLTTFVATSLVMMSSRGSMGGLLGCLFCSHQYDDAAGRNVSRRPDLTVSAGHFVEQVRADATTGRLTP